MRAASARSVGATLLAMLVAGAIAAPLLATHDPSVQFAEFVFAPPMRPRVVDAAGHWRAPFVYPLLLQDRLSRSFGVDTDRAGAREVVPRPAGRLRRGRRGSHSAPTASDVTCLPRLVLGARLSLGVAAIATLAAIGLGGLVGGVAGVAGGRPEALLMAAADFVIALPVDLRGAVAPRGAPARPVQPRGLLDTRFGAGPDRLAACGPRRPGDRRRRGAARVRRSCAGEWRRTAAITAAALLPATYGFLGVQATLLVPAFVLAEATLSYVGLGFSDPTPSWGSMLQSAAGQPPGGGAVAPVARNCNRDHGSVCEPRREHDRQARPDD